MSELEEFEFDGIIESDDKIETETTVSEEIPDFTDEMDETQDYFEDINDEVFSEVDSDTIKFNAEDEIDEE